MVDINEELLGFEIGDANHTARKGPQLERTTSRDIAMLAFSVQWQAEGVSHNDTTIAPKLNFWRDIMPPELEMALTDKPIGFTTSHSFAPGDLIEPAVSSLIINTKNSAFDRQYRAGTYIEPRAGRFYPRGFIAGTEGIYPGDIRPFRVTSVDDEKMQIDLNHPLAGQTLKIQVSIMDIWAAGYEKGGPCSDISELICNNGPGMQARWHGQASDLFSDMPFSRLAPEADAEFYASPRMNPHIDSAASAQICQLYQKLITQDSKVLDLMSSVQSHMPEGLAGHITGLGMNQEEMEANPQLDEFTLHDLNLEPKLPFEDASFDTVTCNLSIGYLIKPFEVFSEVARILRPNGLFVLTFSDRWNPVKVARVWEGTHEFERPGIVLEYFLRDGLFGKLNTWSVRGLPCNETDPKNPENETSDPIYAVWGNRQS